jgi:hypothetical protein
MNAVTAFTKTTLLLNSAWQPITTITAKAAFCHLLKKRISAIDKNGNIFHSLDSWNRDAEFYDDQPALMSSKSEWPIPTVIVVTSKFFRRPKKRKLTLFETAKIYDHTCQYCLKRFPISDLTIDHIFPKSKGGTDEHENRICCCRKCNTSKSNFYPYNDINGKPVEVLSIPALMIHAPKVRPEWEQFLDSLKVKAV